jgi:hypothetical protein
MTARPTACTSLPGTRLVVYRAAPRHALFQGDVIVVPELSYRDRDPRVLSRHGRKRSCSVCRAKVEEKTLCDKCHSQLSALEKNFVRITSIKDRQVAKEDVFATTPEAIANLKPVLAMLESHGCDIDRQGDVAVWGMRPLEALSREQQESVRKGENGSLMLLDDIEGVPACVVDFNAAFTVPSWLLGVQQAYPTVKGTEEKALVPFAEVVEARITSLSARGLKRVYEAKLRHLTRGEYDLDLPTIDDGDPRRPSPNPLPSRLWELAYPKWMKRARPPPPIAATSGA